MWLLDNLVPSLGLGVLLTRYRQLLYQNGYITPRGQIRQRELLNSFRSLYADEFLDIVGCRVDSVQSESWLHRFVRSSRTSSHPLRHILVMCLLNIDPKKFLARDFSSSYAPFGNGPWPCLNAAADHYRENAVEDCKVTRDYKLGIPVGTFACSCGFIYSRRGPDQLEEDRYRYGRIKTFGPIWEQRVVQLYLVEQRSLRETASVLRVDPMTIKHRVECLVSVTPQELTDCENTQRREEYRSRWSSLKEKHPELTKTELRHLEPGIYAWLYRHDRLWIVCDVVRIQHRQSRRERVNWKLRDADLAQKVFDAAIALYRQSDKPVRVTMSRLGKITGSLVLLEKHIDRLPETNQVLQDILEDLEEFQVRRVKWAARQLRARGRPIKRWTLFRVAGLKPGISPSIELSIDLEVAKAKMLEGIADWP